MILFDGIFVSFPKLFAVILVLKAGYVKSEGGSD